MNKYFSLISEKYSTAVGELISDNIEGIKKNYNVNIVICEGRNAIRRRLFNIIPTLRDSFLITVEMEKLKKYVRSIKEIEIHTDLILNDEKENNLSNLIQRTLNYQKTINITRYDNLYGLADRPTSGFKNKSKRSKSKRSKIKNKTKNKSKRSKNKSSKNKKRS